MAVVTLNHVRRRFDSCPWSMIEINSDEINFIDYWNWYDGPIEGVLAWRGQRYWYDMIDRTEMMSEVRRYNVFALTDEVWAKIDEASADFEAHVSGHRKGLLGELKPREEWASYYDKWQDWNIPEEAKTLVGTFEA